MHSRLEQPAHSGNWCDKHTAAGAGSCPGASGTAHGGPAVQRRVSGTAGLSEQALPALYQTRRGARLGCQGPASELACRSLQARTFRRASPARPLLSHAAPRRGSPPLPLLRSKLPPAALARRDAPRGDRAVSPRDSGSADAASGLLLRVEDGAGLDATWMGNARGPDGPCA